MKKVAPTRSGSQLDQSAQERMMRRKPTARTNDRRMTAVYNPLEYRMLLGDY